MLNSWKLLGVISGSILSSHQTFLGAGLKIHCYTHILYVSICVCVNVLPRVEQDNTAQCCALNVLYQFALKSGISRRCRLRQLHHRFEKWGRDGTNGPTALNLWRERELELYAWKGDGWMPGGRKEASKEGRKEGRERGREVAPRQKTSFPSDKLDSISFYKCGHVIERFERMIWISLSIEFGHSNLATSILGCNWLKVKSTQIKDFAENGQTK